MIGCNGNVKVLIVVFIFDSFCLSYFVFILLEVVFDKMFICSKNFIENFMK